MLRATTWVALLLAANVRADVTTPRLEVAAEVRRDLDDPASVSVDREDVVCVVSHDRIVRIPRRGGASVPVPVPPGLNLIYAITDGESLFLSEGHNQRYRVFRMPKRGGPAVELDVPEEVRRSPPVLAVDDRYLYLLEPLSPYAIHRMVKSGGPLERLVTSAHAIAVDDRFLYWIGNDDYALHRRATASGETAVVAAMPKRDVQWLAAGGGWVYWLDGFRLLRVAGAGGAIEVAADRRPSDRLMPAYLAARGATVYSVSRAELVPIAPGADTSTVIPRSAVLRRYGPP